VRRLGKLGREIEKRFDEDNALESKMTQDHCLSLQSMKRLESHSLHKEGFQE